MKLLSADLLDGLLARAGACQRRRSNHNLHEAPEAPIQRLLVGAMRDSYFRPHRHPAKWELVVVLRGQFDLLVFDELGQVTGRVAAGPAAGAVGIELPAGTWHASVPMADDSVFFEVKPGPYDPRTVSEFAAWSPAENSPGAGGFLEILRRAKTGDRVAATAR